MMVPSASCCDLYDTRHNSIHRGWWYDVRRKSVARASKPHGKSSNESKVHSYGAATLVTTYFVQTLLGVQNFLLFLVISAVYANIVHNPRGYATQDSSGPTWNKKRLHKVYVVKGFQKQDNIKMDTIHTYLAKLERKMTTKPRKSKQMNAHRVFPVPVEAEI